MDPAWCYVCRVEQGGTIGHAAWGLDVPADPDTSTWEQHRAPMSEAQAHYLWFLCREFGIRFEDELTEGEAELLIKSFLAEPISESQRRTLDRLGGLYAKNSEGLTYGWAKEQIRRLFAARVLGSTA
jgi:hypothetical protein